MDCEVRRRTVVPYAQAWALQKDLAAARSRDEIPDTLLLLQHPHTYTLGSAAREENLLMSAGELAAKGIEVLHVDRGGDITYHGPGQLTGYPIFRLPRRPGKLYADVILYVRQLEEVLIQALSAFGLRGQRLENFTGVWVENEGALEKVAAIGVKVSAHAVTLHGFALNIFPDLRFFDGIIPCGIPDKAVTSMEKLLGSPLDFETVTEEVIRAVGRVFSKNMLRPDDDTFNHRLPYLSGSIDSLR